MALLREKKHSDDFQKTLIGRFALLNVSTRDIFRAVQERRIRTAKNEE